MLSMLSMLKHSNWSCNKLKLTAPLLCDGQVILHESRGTWVAVFQNLVGHENNSLHDWLLLAKFRVKFLCGNNEWVNQSVIYNKLKKYYLQLIQ